MASPQCIRKDFKQEFLTCSLCTNLYNSEDRVPKCLPCLHCFCKSCLERHIAGKPEVSCPDCRKQCVVPEGGANGFVTNFNVGNLREYQILTQEPRLLPENDGDQICNSCDYDNAATGYCYECEAFVCQNCTEMHNSMRGLRSHEIESLENLLNKPERQLQRRRTYERCRVHNKAYSMFCKTCKKPICDTCGQIITHSNHEKVDLNDVIDKTVRALRELSSDVRNKKEPLERLSAMIDTRINDINAVFAKREEDINELFQKLESRLRDRCSQAKEELQGRCQVLNKLLQEQKADVEALVAQYESACDFADQTCEYASPRQLFKHEEMVTLQLNGLLSETLSQNEPLANSFLDFNSDHREAMEWGEEHFFARIGGTRTSETSASLCYPKVEVNSIVSLGMPQIVLIRAVNYDGKPQQTGGDPFTAELQLPDGTSIPREVHDNDDGTYRINYTADQQGTNHLDVRVFGRLIRASPFSISVQEDASSEVTTNHTVVIDIPNIALVGHPHKILVNTSSEEGDVEKEAKVDRVHATIETQTGDSVKCACRALNADSGQYAIQYTPPVDGLLNVNITVNDIPAKGNPYVVQVQPTSPKASIVTLGRPISNQLWFIRVSPRDYRQNPISVDEEAVNIKVTNMADKTEQELSCRRNKDGALVFTCIPRAGPHLVKASLYDISIVEEEVDVQEYLEINLSKSSKSFPTGITSGLGDMLFVSDTADSSIYGFSVDGARESNIAVDMSKSSQIAIDDQGRLLLLFPQTRMVHTIDQQGNELSRWPCQRGTLVR
ncbi:E3 ubiquitin-protein ligase TRIM45-like [Amphiura filiformis]|uniref:E3 ubiquitin-protein ligase TRIM45-like n=1 Tax=Amphiura filiformis TaxID=82378 RepID=UPI003B225B87